MQNDFVRACRVGRYWIVYGRYAHRGEREYFVFPGIRKEPTSAHDLDGGWLVEFKTFEEARDYCLAQDDIVEVAVIDQLRGLLPGTIRVRRGDRPAWGTGWRLAGEDHCFTAAWDSSD